MGNPANIMSLSMVEDRMRDLVALASSGETAGDAFKTAWNDLIRQHSLLLQRDQELERLLDRADETTTWLSDYETLTAREFREKWGGLANRTPAQMRGDFLLALRSHRK